MLAGRSARAVRPSAIKIEAAQSASIAMASGNNTGNQQADGHLDAHSPAPGYDCKPPCPVPNVFGSVFHGTALGLVRQHWLVFHGRRS
jgi:hypothetical protein